MADGSFRLENESEFIRFAKSSDTWTAIRKDGTVMRFGTTSESRIQDDTGRIFKWLLQEMTDTNGNTIRFFYEKKDASFQRYCTRIEYNPSASAQMTIQFEYESRPDIITDYRARFELKTAYRCTAIRMMAGERPVRSYILKYAVTNDTQPLSLLSGVTQFGTEGMHSLPPAEFTYVSFQGDVAQPVNIPAAPKLSLNNGNIDLIDLNSDGLPDILDTNDTPQDYHLNLGPDEAGTLRWSEKTAMTSATGKYLDTDSTQLADMDGDGRTDLLDLFNTDVQYYKISRSGTEMKWEYEYDDYGNLIRHKEHGRMEEGWDDERVTETVFTAGFESGRSAWILNKVVETRTTDESGGLAAHQRHYYDGNLTLGEVSKGNLTRTEDWVTGERYIVSVRNDYDAYGNVIATYDPFHPASGHWRELIYDETFHTFPEQEIIHTGSDAVPTLTISATYNYGLGVMTASTDFNGHTTSYGYDTFARLTAITKPPDTGHTVEYDYMLAHPLENGKIINWVETRRRDGSADEFLHSRTFYDGLGRKIMTRAEGETSGQVVVTDTVQFNARKQPWKKYLPYFETGTTDFAD